MSSGGAPTPADTSVFTKHNWDMGMGYLWFNGWGILWLARLDIYYLMEGHLCHLMGGAFITYRVGHLSLNGQGIYHLMGGALMAK